MDKRTNRQKISVEFIDKASEVTLSYVKYQLYNWSIIDI